MTLAADNALIGLIRRVALLFTVFLAAMFLVAAPAGAKKTHLFIEDFGSVAQPTAISPTALAVDRSSGDLLVVDTVGKTVSRYNPDGTADPFSSLGTNVIDAKQGPGGKACTLEADSCDQTPQNGFGFSGNGFPGEEQVAVDNSGTLTDGNIYVTGFEDFVNIFASDGHYLGQITAAGATPLNNVCGVAVDPSGNVFLSSDQNIYKFDPSSNPPQNSDFITAYTGSERVCNLAAGAGPSAGSLFADTLFTFKSNSLLKLDGANLAFEGVLDPGEYRLVTVDPVTGHLYAPSGVNSANSGSSTSTPGIVNEFEVSGATASRISSTATGEGIGGVVGIAYDGSAGRLYVSKASNGSGYVQVYGPLVTVPDVSTGAATITGDTSVTVNGTVNPDGLLLDECRFEFGPTTAYGQNAPCAESPAQIGTSSKAVHADLSGLTGETLYHYRLAARNPNTTIYGSDRTFKTPSKPAVLADGTDDVGYAEATLSAKVNPENSPTTYHFEWGPDTSYGQSTPEASLGSGDADHAVSKFLEGLTPGSTYHWRLVAVNGIGTTEGADHSFATYPPPLAPNSVCPNQAFRTGASARLPECRAFEMVSPLAKGNADIMGLTNLSLEQSSAGGERFTYSSATAFGGSLSAPFISQYMATRDPEAGWSTEAINAPRDSVSFSDNAYLKFDIAYKDFSADLSSGWLLQNTEPVLDECGVPGYTNLYRRDQSGSYEALTTVAPPSPATPEEYWPELQGVSADGSHAVFRATARLTSDASKALYNTSVPIEQVYEHIAGEGCGTLRLVSVLPNGKASGSNSTVGNRNQPSFGNARINTFGRAVSADGSRILWSVPAGGTPVGPGPLYDRIEGAKTLAVSADPETRFWTASTDGARVFYTIGDELYEYDVEAALASEPAQTLIAAGVPGVVEASEDGSRLYFLSTEELGGEGEAGKRNLYLREADGTKFIATLGTVETVGQGPDYEENGFTVGSRFPLMRGTRATPDGAQLAFVSGQPLTGYDNRDAADGRPALELFLYDAEAERLACVSCNPSGARPRGRKFTVIPGFVPFRVSAHMAQYANQFFAPRALSEDGASLFFESFEALLPRDTNGAQDVYQWQRASGAEECERIGAELYVAASGGCLSLISTGQSPSDSFFADASPDGSDAFIKTASSLLPQDPGLLDIYDARIGGGFPQPQAIAGCEGEACQGTPAPPNDPTPASAAFQGAGNVTALTDKPRCHKPKLRGSAKGERAKKKGRCAKKRNTHHKQRTNR